MYEVVDKLADEEKCDDYGNQTLFERKKRSWKLCFLGVDSKRKETLTYSDVSKYLAYSVIRKCMWIFTPYLASATEFNVQICPPGKWGSSFEVRCSDDYEELSYLDRENRSKRYIPLSLLTQMLLRYDTKEDKPGKVYDRKRIEKKQKFKSECAQNLMETVIRMYEILQSEAKEIVTVMPVQPELTYEI